MEKPFVVCHMFVSLDGKIDGPFMRTSAAAPALEAYGRLREGYRCDATLYGTVTMAGGFADGWLDQVPPAKGHYPREDWIAPTQEKHYVVSVDPKGELRWSRPYLEKPGRPRAHVIQVLTGQVSDDYVAYLREQGISYLFAGEGELNCTQMLCKLKEAFGIQRVLLAGGGHINGSLLQEDLIDEISLVLAPVIDGSPKTGSSFVRYAFLPNRAPAAFTLLEAKPIEGEGLWLRYALRK